MQILVIKGPVSEEAIRLYANDLGGALFSPFEKGPTGDWGGGVNDHAFDTAVMLANQHGLTIIGVRISRGTPARSAVERPKYRLMGMQIPKPQS